ncbi:hypothetical protein J7E99_19560 [Streptomyces sp. ISL-44]|uniref:hypothetical protein n=1 Tax=Streptomyces sp. ISL-44 TaxID=2819184 RepID=UPI001BE504CE|nr:hypothetical protein [Streptomyces sp. ISL-44]MBT2542851.1 hypothetical protein [Streptomyces sp. ISL-44]
MAWYEGPCRITVIGVDADWPQRAVVAVSGAGGARIEIPGTVGVVRHIEARSWHLELEHQYQGTWRPNIRAVRSRWETVDGVRTQTIHSKDVDWPRNQHERNLVLRLERTGEPAERPRDASRALDAPARAATQSSSGGPAHRTPAGPAHSPTSSSSAGPSFTAPPATSPARTSSHGPTTGSSPW